MKELDKSELKEVDGGSIILGVLVVALAGGFIYATIDNWDACAEAGAQGFEDGFKAGSF
jgi:lactobin A/cerein 7B family class IIb bacteriocin